MQSFDWKTRLSGRCGCGSNLGFPHKTAALTFHGTASVVYSRIGHLQHWHLFHLCRRTGPTHPLIWPLPLRTLQLARIALFCPIHRWLHTTREAPPVSAMSSPPPPPCSHRYQGFQELTSAVRSLELQLQALQIEVRCMATATLRTPPPPSKRGV